jgi:glycogenin
MARSYVSLVTTKEYIPGVVALRNSLMSVSSTYPLQVMVPDELLASVLAELQLPALLVEEITNPYRDTASCYRTVFTKLRAWGLTQFERIVFLDADVLVVQNIDHLFDVRGFAAAPDAKAPDVFNAGVMVIEPNNEVLLSMESKFASLPSYDGGDQGFLNSFFRDWFESSHHNRLRFGYNYALESARMEPSYLDSLKSSKSLFVIHFWGRMKPWKLGDAFDARRDEGLDALAVKAEQMCRVRKQKKLSEIVGDAAVALIRLWWCHYVPTECK